MPIRSSVTSTLALLVLLQGGSAAASASRFNCLIEPTQTVNIRSPVIGVLKKVTVRRGDYVKKGQVLAQLDSSVELAATRLARYKAKMMTPITTAENKMDFARRKYVRHQGMHAENFVSAQELEEAENEFKLAQSELKMSHENQELAVLEWEYQDAQLKLRTIRSPFNGVVVGQDIYPGEVVEPSREDADILRLAQLDPLRVYVILPLAAFGKVEKDMAVMVYPERPKDSRFSGTVNIIDKVVDAASGTFGVFLEMANPNLTVPAGVKCIAEFPFAITDAD